MLGLLLIFTPQVCFKDGKHTIWKLIIKKSCFENLPQFQNWSSDAILQHSNLTTHVRQKLMRK